MADLHKTRQTAFRLPEGLLSWLREQAQREGGEATMTSVTKRALERERERCEGITTAPPVAEPVSPPVKRTRKPAAPPAETVAETARKPAARECPPHPKRRVNKGLCSACHRNVGNEEVR